MDPVIADLDEPDEGGFVLFDQSEVGVAERRARADEEVAALDFDLEISILQIEQ